MGGCPSHHSIVVSRGHPVRLNANPTCEQVSGCFWKSPTQAATAQKTKLDLSQFSQCLRTETSLTFGPASSTSTPEPPPSCSNAPPQGHRYRHLRGLLNATSPQRAQLAQRLFPAQIHQTAILPTARRNARIKKFQGMDTGAVTPLVCCCSETDLTNIWLCHEISYPPSREQTSVCLHPD